MQEKEIKSNEKLLVYQFGASWCGQCRKLKPVVMDVVETYKDKIDFEYKDIDQDDELAKQFSISTLPTIVIIKNSTPLDKLIGLISRNKLMETIEKYL